MDPDLTPAPDPANFVNDLQDGKEKFQVFLLITFYKLRLEK
jgi:hypothetical protein